MIVCVCQGRRRGQSLPFLPRSCTGSSPAATFLCGTCPQRLLPSFLPRLTDVSPQAAISARRLATRRQRKHPRHPAYRPADFAEDGSGSTASLPPMYRMRRCPRSLSTGSAPRPLAETRKIALQNEQPIKQGRTMADFKTMNWLNPPPGAKFDGQALTVKTGSRTDFRRGTSMGSGATRGTFFTRASPATSPAK